MLTGVDAQLMRQAGADMTSCMADATPAATQRAEALLALAKGHQRWCETGGKEGKPAVFDGEDLRPLGGRLRGLMLTAMSAKGACMVGVDMAGCQLQGANFEGADLRAAVLVGCDLRGARMVGANLTKADLRKAALCALPLGAARTTPTHLERIKLRYASCEGADLNGAMLDDADLGGADLTGASLKGASLRGAEMSSIVGLDLDRQAA